MNRIVSVGITPEGKKYVDIEPDSRHVDYILKTLGLNNGKVKTVIVPGTKLNDAQIAMRKESPMLSPQDCTTYRGNVMRAAFLAQDRADIGDAVRSLAQGMANPKQSH